MNTSFGIEKSTCVCTFSTMLIAFTVTLGMPKECIIWIQSELRNRTSSHCLVFFGRVASAQNLVPMGVPAPHVNHLFVSLCEAHDHLQVGLQLMCPLKSLCLLDHLLHQANRCLHNQRSCCSSWLAFAAKTGTAARKTDPDDGFFSSLDPRRQKVIGRSAKKTFTQCKHHYKDKNLLWCPKCWVKAQNSALQSPMVAKLSDTNILCNVTSCRHTRSHLVSREA